MSEIITTRESAKKRVKKNPPNESVENFIDSKIRQLEAEVVKQGNNLLSKLGKELVQAINAKIKKPNGNIFVNAKTDF